MRRQPLVGGNCSVLALDEAGLRDGREDGRLALTDVERAVGRDGLADELRDGAGVACLDRDDRRGGEQDRRRLDLPAWPRYAGTPVFSRTYAVAWNVALSVVALPKSNFGFLTAAEPSAFLRNVTWAASCLAMRSRCRATSPPNFAATPCL